MKDMNNLAKRGWSKAMIHQRTLSLVLTLDNFLLSGPHVLFADKYQEALSDPNVFVVQNRIPTSGSTSELDKVENQSLAASAHTYYVLRSFVRGILFGLNPLYQISLFVPCTDPKMINLYKEIISKIDIGGLFFQDRIYWSLESLRRDIMDERLTCLIYADNTSMIKTEWIKKVSIESKPFVATLDSENGINTNLFDLVEMRGFLEEMHQRYFSVINEIKNTHFVNMIRFYISETNSKKGTDNEYKAIGFYSVNNGNETRNHLKKHFISDRYSLKKTESKPKNSVKMFKNPPMTTQLWGELNSKLLIEEYENIILEQLKINHQISEVDIDPDLFAKYLCRWNMITLRKSEILKSLLTQKDTKSINEKLKYLNAIYYQRRYQDGTPDSDIFRSTQSQYSSLSETSDDSCYIIISEDHETKKSDIDDFHNTFFTTWYVDKL